MRPELSCRAMSFFSSWNQNRKQVVSSPQHCDWGLLVAICTNMFGTQFLQSLDGALWKNQEREMFPKIFLQSQFQGGRRTVLFRNSNFDPISWFKVFLHEQPCKIFQASCSSSKEEEPTHFSSFKLDNFLPFPLSSIVLSWKKLDGSFLLKIGFFALKIYFYFHELNAHFTFFCIT